MAGLMKAAVVLGFLLAVYAADIQWTDNSVDVKQNKDANAPTISLKYISNNDFSKNQQNVPAIVHLTFGGDAKTIANEQTYIYSLAQQLNATIYVVEHRFFGTSFPPGITDKNLTDYDSVKNIDAVNAVEDIKAVITKIRNGNDNLNIILTGAEYAGELATLVRRDDAKIYGSIVFGSALRLHKDMGAKLGDYDKQLKDAYVKEGCKIELIQSALKLIIDTDSKDDAGKAIADDIITGLKINSVALTYNDDKPAILTYIHTAFEHLAKENYDTKHDHGDYKFDRRPLKAYCDAVNKLSSPITTAQKVVPLQLLIDAYYQQTDVEDGLHTIGEETINTRGGYIECFVTTPYHCRLGGSNDDFKPVCTDTDDSGWLTRLLGKCKNRFPVTNVKGDSFKTLVNGFKFDDLQKAIYVYGASDPSSVGKFDKVDAAKQQFQFVLDIRVINIAKCWLSGSTTNDCSTDKFTTQLKDFSYVTGDTCDDDKTLSYPWGQDKPDTGGTDPTKKPDDPKPKTTTPYSSAPATIQLFTHLSILAAALLFWL
ncbi:hypothetical protein M3Y97_00618500 [Aphelenchoides bicaudatus]|nr:hypothetical protein M3Y97_00618500 [Aphelenchoides bicaudatus]